MRVMLVSRVPCPALGFVSVLLARSLSPGCAHSSRLIFTFTILFSTSAMMRAVASIVPLVLAAAVAGTSCHTPTSTTSTDALWPSSCTFDQDHDLHR